MKKEYVEIRQNDLPEDTKVDIEKTAIKLSENTAKLEEQKHKNDFAKLVLATLGASAVAYFVGRGIGSLIGTTLVSVLPEE